MFTATVTNSSILAVVDGQPYSVDASHPFFSNLIDAIKNEDQEEFLVYLEKESEQDVLETNEHITIEGSNFFYKGERIHNTICDRMLEMQRKGFKIEHMIKFLDNLMDNPSKRSVDQLYTFLEANKIPITDDGHFLAYKSVRENYLDKYSGTISNNVGNVVEVQRNKVDDNPDRTCSNGLHVGGFSYSGPGGWYNNSGDKVILVKVNPKDVVSVPNDHGATKLRVCKYEVVADYQSQLNKVVYKSNDQLINDSLYDATKIYISAQDLDHNDLVSFEYKGETRYGTVYSLEGDSIVMIVDRNDPSYELNRTTYRRFIISEMKQVALLEDDLNE